MDLIEQEINELKFKLEKHDYDIKALLQSEKDRNENCQKHQIAIAGIEKSHILIRNDYENLNLQLKDIKVLMKEISTKQDDQIEKMIKIEADQKSDQKQKRNSQSHISIIIAFVVMIIALIQASTGYMQYKQSNSQQKTPMEVKNVN